MVELTHIRRGGRLIPLSFTSKLIRRIAQWKRRREPLLIMQRRDTFPLIVNAEHPLGEFRRWYLRRTTARLSFGLLHDARKEEERIRGDELMVEQSNRRVRRILVGRRIVDEQGQLLPHWDPPDGVVGFARPQRRRV